MRHEITLTINGEKQHLTVASNQTLLRVLREDLRLTGAKHACDSGTCGACSVLVNGEIVNACLVLAVEADGADILTVEGLATGASPHPLQQAFSEQGAMQCGYCTSGMLIAAYALLKSTSRPNEEEIKAALSGNYCRCTGYADIIKSIQVAARTRR